jgi:PAS domain S-box-containing protein
MTHGAALKGFYDYRLVALSFVIAIFAAYAALDLAGRVTAARGRIRFAWLMAGAFAMGIGIWSMHYAGMEALRLPVPVEYDWPTVLLSMVAAVLASAIALLVVSRKTMGVAVVIAGSILMGSGIAAMHYIGMAAMRLPAMCSYSPSLVALSVAVAIVISFVAMELSFGVRGQMASWSWRKSGSALAMGLAIPVMHYIGMAAVSFWPAPLPASELTHALAISGLGEAGICLITLLLLAVMIVASMLDRLIELHAEAQKEGRSREELASIVDYSDDAIIGKSLDGNIVSWNKGAERLYGYSAGEVLGKPISILLPPDRPDEISAILAKAMRGLVVSEETVRRRKDGSLIDVALTVSPIRNSLGQVTAASSIARDISERKRVEQRIMNLNAQLERTAAEAEAANRAKSTFLSTMSHEIRTPMNAILGYSQLMLRDQNLGAGAKANLKIIGRSGEHLLALINDVLDMSKIEAGRVELNPATFSLAGLLSDLDAMFHLRAGAKGLQFKMSLDGEAVPYIVADEGKVRQVFVNLLGNAVKFTQAGQIRLLATLEPRDADQLWMSARVEDTGPGIADEDQKKLFESFSQTRSGVDSLQGTGLGLAISRKFARLMGGDITVVSSFGRGSLFRFEIPVERGEAGVALKPAIPRHVRAIRAGQEAPKILVVDDNFENRDWLIKLVTSVGFSARPAENGEAAVRVWEEWHPSLILMDVHMPVMDGLEATRRIKADPHGKETFVVVLTASAMDHDRRAVAQSGADGFVAKPCREDELLEKMRSLLDLVYDYEELEEADRQPVAAQPVLNSERLRHLPRELIEEIRTATLSGNKKLLDRLILQVLEGGDAESAQGLQDLADKYEFDALTQLLEETCRL